MSAVGRPFIVTLLGVIVIIFGILGIIAGIGGLFSGTGVLIALVTIILGLIYVLVARGLFRGSGGARFIIAIVTVLHLHLGDDHVLEQQRLGHTLLRGHDPGDRRVAHPAVAVHAQGHGVLQEQLSLVVTSWAVGCCHPTA